jgi:serine/threonine protein kinase
LNAEANAGLPDSTVAGCYSDAVACLQCGSPHPQHLCPTPGQPLRPSLPGKLAPGAVLDGKYRIVREVGRGAMGVVYEAVHIALGRKVAVKTLLEDVRADAQMGERFEREARAASAIGHPNIIDVFDLGHTQDGILFMVMELLDGRSLGDLLKETPQLPIPLTIHLMAQTLSGLSAAHKHGIVHRDLKPDNIFVLDSEERPNFVKIVDFGISKLLAESHPAVAVTVKGTGTMVGSILGTPLYMSPEQAVGQIAAIDHRTDIYSAGVVLYEMLCGRTPFVGQGYAQILGSLVEGNYPQPSSLRPEMSRDLEAAIACALDRDRDKRFSSAAAMRTAISEGLADATPTPVVLSAAFGNPLGAGFGAPEESDSIALRSEQARATRRRSLDDDPFAPPPDNQQAVPLAQEPVHAAVEQVVDGAVRPAAGSGADPKPEHPARTKKFSAATGIAVASLLVVAALAASLAATYLRKEQPGPAKAESGKKYAMRLLVEPSQASIQIDHVPTATRGLTLEGGLRHEINAAAPGRLTRRFTFDSNASGMLSLRLGRQLPLPSATDPPALATELTADDPDQPRSVSDLNRAFDKLDHYTNCLAMIGDAASDGKKSSARVRLRKEELALCQRSVAEAAADGPDLAEVQAAAEAFLDANQKSQKADILGKLAVRFRAEFLASQAVWQMEELARQGKDDGQKALWHMRRVALAARAWLRALRTPVQDSKASTLREYQQALADFAGGSAAEVEHVSGSADLLSASQAVALLSRDKKANEVAALDGCRKLLSAFNALVDDTPGRPSERR